jgi:hypothetical protein
MNIDNDIAISEAEANNNNDKNNNSSSLWLRYFKLTLT